MIKVHSLIKKKVVRKRNLFRPSVNSTSPTILVFLLFDLIPILKNGRMLKSKAFILSEVPFLCEQSNLKFETCLRTWMIVLVKMEVMLVARQRFSFWAIIDFLRTSLVRVMLNWKLSKIIFVLIKIYYRNIADIPQNQKFKFWYDFKRN